MKYQLAHVMQRVIVLCVYSKGLPHSYNDCRWRFSDAAESSFCTGFEVELACVLHLLCVRERLQRGMYVRGEGGGVGVCVRVRGKSLWSVVLFKGALRRPYGGQNTEVAGVID